MSKLLTGNETTILTRVNFTKALPEVEHSVTRDSCKIADSLFTKVPGVNLTVGLVEIV